MILLNAKLAEELLLRQEQVLEEIYGTQDEDMDPNEEEENLSDDWTEDSFSEDEEDMVYEPESEKEEMP